MLDKIILEEIRKATYYARAKTQEFIDIYFRYIGNLTVQPVEQAGWKERTGSRNCPSCSQYTALRHNCSNVIKIATLCKSEPL